MVVEAGILIVFWVQKTPYGGPVTERVKDKTLKTDQRKEPYEVAIALQNLGIYPGAACTHHH